MLAAHLGGLPGFVTCRAARRVSRAHQILLATQVLHHTKSAAAGKLLDRRSYDHAQAEFKAGLQACE